MFDAAAAGALEGALSFSTSARFSAAHVSDSGADLLAQRFA
jgi:hypothetical protein